MCVKTSVRQTCQHNYYCSQHYHFVNSTQISDVIKRLCFGKSDGDYNKRVLEIIINVLLKIIINMLSRL